MEDRGLRAREFASALQALQRGAAIRRGLLAGFAVVGSVAAIASAADGQVLPSTSLVAPLVQRVDSNGIDLLTGGYNYRRPTLSIGTPEDGGLSLGSTYGNTVQSTENSGGISLSSGAYTVTIGSRSVQFVLSGSQFVDVLQFGATLAYDSNANIYTFTDRDGSVATFSGAMAHGATSPGNVALIQSLTHPNGVALTYTYAQYTGGPDTLWRSVSVVSNAGYALKYEYESDTSSTSVGYVFNVTKITAINNAYDYCDPNATHCASLTQAWPSLGFNPPTASGSGQTMTAQWGSSDPLNNWTNFSVASTATGTTCGGGSPVNDFYQRVTEAHASGFQKIYTFGNYCGADSSHVVDVAYPGGGLTTYAYATRGLSNPLMASTVVQGPLSGQIRTVTWINAQNGVGGGNPILNIGTDTDSYGNVKTYTYDAYGRVASVTYPEGNSEQVQYDSRHNVTSLTKIAKPGSNLANIVETAGYDATCTYPAKCNKANWVKDANGNETDYTYDNVTGLLLTVTKPAGANGVRPVTSYSYQQIPTYALNAAGGSLAQVGSIWMLSETQQCNTSAATVTYAGLIATVSCGAGAHDLTQTLISYSGSYNAQPTSVTVQSGDGSLASTTAKTYDMVGNVATSQGPLGPSQTTQYWYDAAREKIGEVGPHPDLAGMLPYRAIRTSYNPDGLVTMVEQGTVPGQSWGQWASFSPITQSVTVYDSLDQVASKSQVEGGVTSSLTQYAYDLANRVQCVAVRMNASAFASAPVACSLGTQGVNGPDRITYNSYDLDNRLIQVTDAYLTSLQRNTRTLTYNTTSPDNGNLQAETDADGNRTAYAYDGFDRLSVTTFPAPANGSATTEILAYDANSNVVQDTRRDGQVVTKSYDALNRLTSVSNPASAYTYDNLGQLTSSSRNGFALTYAYDALGRQTCESASTCQSGATGMFQFGYDAAGELTQITWPDSFVVNYAWDLVGEVTQIQESAAGNGAILADYSYNNLGQRTALSRGNGVNTTYGYDAAWRLSSVAHAFPSAYATANNESIALTRNEASQIISHVTSNGLYDWSVRPTASTSYAINALNQVASAGAGSYAYDQRGNMTSDGVNTYTYDLANNLTGFNAGVTMATDGEGRLSVVRDLSGGVVTSSSRGFRYGPTTEMGGSVLLAEYGVSSSDSGALYRRYVPGPGVDETLVWYDSSDGFQRRWLLPDERGSIMAVINASGALMQANTYDEYGVPGPSNLGRFQYTGQLWIPEIGLHHYKARTYSPTLGRFLQTDPVGYKADLELYAYVGEDPLNRTDPTGQTPAAAIGLGALVAESAKDGAAAGCAITAEIGCVEGAVVLGAGGVIVGGGIWACAKWCGPIFHHIKKDPPPFKDDPKNKPPFQGEPGSTVRGGTGSRTYGPDGYPQTDRDHPHPDEAPPGNGDHSHDWTRPEGGGPPVAPGQRGNPYRGPARPPQSGDPPQPRGPNVPPPEV